MSDCSNHKKELFGETDMKVVAEAIGDLHYETLAQLLAHLGDKLYEDAEKDSSQQRDRLSDMLFKSSFSILEARGTIEIAWLISKRFMTPPLSGTSPLSDVNSVSSSEK